MLPEAYPWRTWSKSPFSRGPSRKNNEKSEIEMSVTQIIITTDQQNLPLNICFVVINIRILVTNYLLNTEGLKSKMAAKFCQRSLMIPNQHIRHSSQCFIITKANCFDSFIWVYNYYGVNSEILLNAWPPWNNCPMWPSKWRKAKIGISKRSF